MVDLCDRLISFYSTRSDFAARSIVSMLRDLQHPLRFQVVQQWYLRSVQAFQAANPGSREIPVRSQRLCIFLMDLLTFYDRRSVHALFPTITPKDTLLSNWVNAKGGMDAVQSSLQWQQIYQGMKDLCTMGSRALELWNAANGATASPLNGSDDRIAQFLHHTVFISNYHRSLPPEKARAMFLFNVKQQQLMASQQTDQARSLTLTHTRSSSSDLYNVSSKRLARIPHQGG